MRGLAVDLALKMMGKERLGGGTGHSRAALSLLRG
jgi:hypothetical protein